MNADAPGSELHVDHDAHDAPAVPSSFLRTLAHELRNYVAPVQNANHLLRLRARNDPALQPVIEIIERQLAGMLRTLDAVGEADRVRRGELRPVREATSIETIVARAVDATRVLQEGRPHAVDVALAPDLPPLEVDPDRIARALAAVLDNALRYTARETRVRIAARRENDVAVIDVQDDGPGLPEGAATAVPEPFLARHVPGHGLGLGLPLARAVLRLHGGDLRLTTNAGGTAVALLLPLDGASSPRASATDTTVQNLPPARTRARRVLLADDSAAVRRSLSDLLQEMGHDVRSAADGAEAVALAQSWQPEFVLLDVHMPKLNGFEAARQIRAAFPPSRVQLVLMSGEDLDEPMRRGARAAGFDHCIDKGLAIGELGAILARGAPG
jgi:CheY-like chemotaxis protein